MYLPYIRLHDDTACFSLNLISCETFNGFPLSSRAEPLFLKMHNPHSHSPLRAEINEDYIKAYHCVCI